MIKEYNRHIREIADRVGERVSPMNHKQLKPGALVRWVAELGGEIVVPPADFIVQQISVKGDQKSYTLRCSTGGTYEVPGVDLMHRHHGAMWFLGVTYTPHLRQ